MNWPCRMYGTCRKWATALLDFCCLVGQLVHAGQDDEKAARFDTRVRKAITAHVDERLSKWTPGKEDSRQPNKKIMAADTEIVGEWVVNRGGHDYTTLSISRNGDRLSISFYTGGCLTEWELERTGMFSEGVLLLDRPVEEYLPLTYKKLYAGRIDGKELLVSSAAVREFEKALSEDSATVIDEVRLEGFSFRRKSPQPASRPEDRASVK